MSDEQDQGVAASPPGHQPTASAAVPASSRSGVPNAGEIGLADTSMFRDEYQLVRVVKAGELGKMWLVEPYRRAILSTPAQWEQPRRRKVCEWMPLGDADPALACDLFREKAAKFRRAQKEALAAYLKDVRATAQGIVTPSGDETRSGSVPKG